MDRNEKIAVGALAIIVVLISLIFTFSFLKERKGTLTVTDLGTGNEKSVTISLYPEWAWKLPGIDNVERVTVDNCEGVVWGGETGDIGIQDNRLPRQENYRGSYWTERRDLSKRYDIISIGQCRAKFSGDRVA